LHNRGYTLLHSFVGSVFTPPQPMDRPAAVHRMLYYQDRGGLDSRAMLEGVIEQVRRLRGDYQRVEGVWVVDEHWDADSYLDHSVLYKQLQQLAHHSAWFARIGDKGRNGAKPAAARWFPNHQIVYSAEMWAGREPLPLRSAVST